MNPQYSDNNKPVVKGPVDGNIFAVLGAATRTLKRAGYPDAAKECADRVMQAPSYDHALAIVMEYVEFDL